MNLSQSPLRRTAALAAGAMIGLTGAVAFASPALAHHSEGAGVAKCDTATGEWVVNWTIHGIGGRWDQPYRLTKVELTPPGTTVTNIKASDEGTYPYTGRGEAGDKLVVGEQRFSGSTDATAATLTVRAAFEDPDAEGKDGHGDSEDKIYTAPLQGECEKPVEPSTPASESPSPEPSTPASESPSPEPSASESPVPSTPASPEPSTPVSPSPSESTPAVPAEEIPVDADIKEIFEVTCDTITIGLDNPEDSLPINLHYKTSKGEERDLTIKPGEAKSETFSASEGFNVDVTISVKSETEDYSETVNIPWEKPAGEDCDGGEGGGLPVTGAAAGGIAGGAAALLAVGGLLFFMARRRKVKFTA